MELIIKADLFRKALQRRAPSPEQPISEPREFGITAFVKKRSFQDFRKQRQRQCELLQAVQPFMMVSNVGRNYGATPAHE
jgi:hypothetical protein